MLRKPLFTAIFLVSILTPTLSFAQVASSSPATLSDIYNIQQQIAELQVQLKIQLLLEQIASLKAQIEQVLANQTQTNQVVSNLQTSLQSAPVLGVVSSTPVAVAEPFKLKGVGFGEYGTYQTWANYNYGKSIDALEVWGITKDIEPLVNQTEITVTSTKAIDPTKTELYVNGQLKPLTVSNVQQLSPTKVRFTVTPNVWSYATYDPHVFDGATYSNYGENVNQHLTLVESINLKLYSTTGESENTPVISCLATPYREVSQTKDSNGNQITQYSLATPRSGCHGFGFPY